MDQTGVCTETITEYQARNRAILQNWTAVFANRWYRNGTDILVTAIHVGVLMWHPGA